MKLLNASETIGAAGSLNDVERELDDHVLLGRLDVGDGVAELLRELRKDQRDRFVRRLGMSGVVVRVVSQRTERERVLVDVARVTKQRFHEVARPDVVQEVAEEFVAKRVVAEILDDRPAIGIGSRLVQHLWGRVAGSGAAEAAVCPCPRPRRSPPRARGPSRPRRPAGWHTGERRRRARDQRTSSNRSVHSPCRRADPGRHAFSTAFSR